jgi:hypothetical protein
MATQTFSIDIPLAEARDADGGWTISTEFIRQIEQKTGRLEHVCDEEIESVIVALFDIPINPKAVLDNREQD